MTKNRPQIDDLKARRDALRGRLRAKADRVLGALEVLPTPKTLSDAEDAAQAVMACDKMLIQVFSDVPSYVPTFYKAKLH